MTTSTTPQDGDFASYMETRAMLPSAAPPASATGTDSSDLLRAERAVPTSESVNQVLVGGEAPSQELLEELKALERAPAISDEELTQQALDAPGADGDPRTPE